MTETAPFHAELACGPQDGAAHWLTTADDMRIRMGFWSRDAERGTVLIFPGRSEYVEKYCRLAADLAGLGFASVAIDWRGQGLAGRLHANRALGHVDSFADYQTDADAVLAEVRRLGLPEPYYLIGHSMGGCIGLRSLLNGLEVEAAAFTAPMWGILMAPALRPIAWTLSSVSRPFGFGHVFAPGQVPEPYVSRVTFEENHLTSDPEMFAWLRGHLEAEPDLGLGGPSLNWLNQALIEMRALRAMASPDVPCMTYLGSRENIVDPEAMRNRMARWPDGRLVELTGAMHEILVERPVFRAQVLSDLDAHFRPHDRQRIAC